MCQHFLLDKEIIPAQQDLCHHIAFVAVVFQVVFCSQVVEAINAWPGVFSFPVKGIFAVPVNYFVAALDEFKAYVAAWFHDVAAGGLYKAV